MREGGRVPGREERPGPPAVRYGATIGFRDGWKLFLSCYGTTRPDQPRPDQPYHPASHI